MPADISQIPKTVRTTCPYCGVGCGVLATSRGEEDVKVRGDDKHPANFGRLCSKGSALGETLSLEGRLLKPQIGGSDASWDDTLDRVAKRFSSAIATSGPDSVAFYVSGQLLTEDYYVANKLMKGFIGSGNIDTNSRLCMSSSVAGHKRAFGEDLVPGVYEDIELADVVVLVGSNLAWCHPILFQRLLAAKESNGTKVVVIDPRATATTEAADLHLEIAPGSDVALFNCLLIELVRQQKFNLNYVNRSTTHFESAVHTASTMSIQKCSDYTRISKKKITEFIDLFLSTERVMTLYSQGVNQSTSGTDKVNAIINCHLATGRIGAPGMGPFSLTGQPNAMGGREVGGLSSTLACHMDIENEAHQKVVRTFWDSPNIASKQGLKAVDLMKAVNNGQIQALWIMGTSPVDSMPNADFVRSAISNCPFVVVSDVMQKTGTSAVADILLPSLAWGEKNGTVTNSERRISRQRAFIPSPAQARPDWWQLAEVGKRMGFERAFTYTNEAEIFSEYAALSGFKNKGHRAFDISACAELDEAAYDKLEPFQWPRPRGQDAISPRLFSDGVYYTADRKARFVPTPYRPPANLPDAVFPFVMNTGRIRDQWHTMTRTGKSARLSAHIAEPFVEIHPDDALVYGVEDACLLEVRSKTAKIIVRALITKRQQRGSVFVPMHWTDNLASSARVDSLVQDEVDPLSGQPEFKATPVAISRFPATTFGFSILRERPSEIAADYWAIGRAKSGWRLELAWRHQEQNWNDYAKNLLGVGNSFELLSYSDALTGAYRFAAFDGANLTGALFVGPTPVAVSRTYAAECLDREWNDPQQWSRMLAGKSPVNERDRGATICSCFDVGFNDIVDAVSRGNCMSVDAVGKALQAGTNCGSCRPEIRRIINDHTLAKAS